MAKRKIKFLCCEFKNASLKIAKEVITQVTIQAQFDQLVAESLGIKKEVYDDNGHVGVDVQAWEFGLEYFGATLRIIPRQGTLDGKIKIEDEGQAFPSLNCDSFNVRKPKDELALRLRFRVSMLDPDGEMHGILQGIKHAQFDAVLDLADKKTATEAEEAAKQAGLFGRPPKDEEEAEDSERATVEA